MAALTGNRPLTHSSSNSSRSFPPRSPSVALAKKAVGDLRGGKSTEASDVLREAAVHWVLANPVLRANTMPFLGR